MAPSAPAKGSSTSTPTTSTSVKRACDACHRRKVKCDGLNPCRNCSSAQLACTYHAIPQKKGPKGSRAKVISELRETQRQSTLSSKVHGRLNGYNPVLPPTLAPTPGLLTQDMINTCIDFFFNNMYTTVPILHRGRLEQQSRFVDRDVETYCLFTALCAFMMIQPGMPIPGDPLGLDSMPGANMMTGTMLLEETLRVRKGYDHLETPTLNSLVTSYFLFACYYGIDTHTKAWFHLREATTLAHILNMNKEETYMSFDPIESSRRRRLYWLLFVTERAYALQRHRPLSLQATINLPTASDDPTECAPPLQGFVHLVNVFRPFDDSFVAQWNKTRDDCTQQYLSTLQKQLMDTLPAYLQSTSESQAADLRVSQQWLRTMVWQLSIQNGFLSSGSEDPSMTFSYPVEISRDLITMTSGFSRQSLEVHGVGLTEKLFDVACSLTDVLALLPTPSDPFAIGPRDYLNQFLSLLSSLRNGDNRFLPLLLQKVHDVLPRLVNPMLQVVPENAASQMAANVDIFDGFGNAGMGVPVVPVAQMGMQRPQIQQFDSSKGRIQELPEPPTSNPQQNHNQNLPQHNQNHQQNSMEQQHSNASGSQHNQSQSPYSQEGQIFTSPPLMESAGLDNQMSFPGMDAYSYLPADGGSGMQNGLQNARPLGLGVGVGGRDGGFMGSVSEYQDGGVNVGVGVDKFELQGGYRQPRPSGYSQMGPV